MLRRRLVLTGIAGTLGVAALDPFGASALALDTARGGVTAVPARVARARALFRAAAYRDLAVALPGWIQLSEAAREAATGRSRDRASAALARLYALACELSVKQGENAAAGHAAGRSMAAAGASGDPVALAEAARSSAIALRRRAQYQASSDLLVRTVDRLDVPGPQALGDTLAVRGTLLLTAAYAQAQGGNGPRAVELAEEAEAAALRARGLRVGGGVPFARDFGTDQCALYRIGIHHALGEDDAALDYARRVDLARLPSPERRARYGLDTARAAHGAGRNDVAVRALELAERYAPQDARRPSTRALVAQLLDEPGPKDRLPDLARRIGVPASAGATPA